MSYDPLPHAPPVIPGIDSSDLGSGMWLVLHFHHDGTSYVCSAEEVAERLKWIRTRKPVAERPARLRNLGLVAWTPEVENACVDWRLAGAIADSDRCFASHHAITVLDAGGSRRDYDAEVTRIEATYRAALGVASRALLAAVHPLSVEEWEARR